MSDKIIEINAYVLETEGEGGDYHNQKTGHWIIDSMISNPMSAYKDYKHSRTSWGINVLKSIVVEIITESGIVAYSTGLGGVPACWMIENHFRRFLIDQNPRDINKIWDQIYKASMFYGRKGITIAALSAVDLALWELLGLIRQEPVYYLIGGKTKESIPVYCTGPDASLAKNLGFWGGKVPLPYGPADKKEGLRKNIAFLEEERKKIGRDFPLMVDCYMSLNVPYAIELAKNCEHLDIEWWEEVLHPDDVDGYIKLKQAHPDKKWTTGEHEYTRYGFLKLLETRCIDILQPDVMWAGGMTELLRISAMASSRDIPVIPHGSGAYSYHFIFSQPHCDLCEYINPEPKGKAIVSVFSQLFTNEILPKDGKIKPSDLPGFGLKLNPNIKLKPIK